MTAKGRPPLVSRRAVLPGALAAALGALHAGPALANPAGGQVVGGQATIANTAPNTVTIDQATPRAAIDWQSFNIAPNETTRFVQPSASAIALNRVRAGDPSVIAGQLTANGQIILINPSGVLFTRGAQVNVNSLLATPTDIGTADFMAGRSDFNIPSSDPNARIVNNGRITVAQKGLAALVGPGVANNGVIAAKLGRVVLGGAQTYTLDFYGDGLMRFDIGSQVATAPLATNGQPVTSLVSNRGKIEAPGGTVLLSASAAAGILTHVIDMPGTIDARTANVTVGNVTIDAGPANNAELSGKIDVSGLRPGQTGGSAVVTGGSADLASTARIDARGSAGGGRVAVGSTPASETQTATIAAGASIDTSATRSGNGGTVTVLSGGTTSFAGTILANGGPEGGNGGNVETSGGQLVLGPAATVSAAAANGLAGTWLLDPTNLTIDATAATAIDAALAANTNVTEQTTAGTVSGFGTVTAGIGDIDVNSAISWSGTGALTLSAYANVNVNAAITESGAAQLNLTSNTGNAGATITVGAPITVSGAGGVSFQTTGNTTGPVFVMSQLPSVSSSTLPTGEGSVQFTGGSGAGAKLTINSTAYTLIYNTGTGTDGLQNPAINGSSASFALATSLDASGLGTLPSSPIPTFSGNFNGLGNTVSNLTIDSTVSLGNVGLFGFINAGGSVANFGVVGGSVTGASDATVGDLAGAVNANGTIFNSYATGAVHGGSDAGGLVAANLGSISQSYATGAVSGGSVSAGGLVGNQDNTGTISNSFATGSVHGGGISGGLVGFNAGSITSAFATGTAFGGALNGGLVGQNDGTNNITNGYWDTSSSGNMAGVSPEATGKTTAQLASALPAGFSSSVWGNVNNQVTPYILTNPGPVLIGTEEGTNPPFFTPVFNGAQLQAIGNAANLSGRFVLAQDIDMTGVTGFTPIGCCATSFSGTFNGLGNVVANLTVAGNARYAGLFGHLTGTVENIGVIGGSVTQTCCEPAGGLVSANDGTILNSYSTASVSGGGSPAAGGLVGINATGTIADSYATGPVNDGGGAAGGLVGSDVLGTISNAYATGAVTSSVQAGGLVGAFGSGVLTNAYAAGAVSGATSGGFIGQNSGGGTITGGYWNGDRAGTGSTGVGSGSSVGVTELGVATDSSPFAAAAYPAFNFTNTPGATGNNWVMVEPNGTLATNGSAAIAGTMPMLAVEAQSVVQNAHQLQLMAMNLPGSYTLGRNIDASATGSSTSVATGTDVWGSGGWVPIGITTSFTGTLNGANSSGGVNTISGLTVSAPATSAGLFDVIGTAGTIENVGLVGGSITDTVAVASVGDLAALNEGAITNTYATGSVSGVNGGFGGGLVGANDGSITNSFAAGGVNGSGSDLGGLVGVNQGTITQSFAAGPVTSSNGGKTGGLVGRNEDIITDAYAVGAVTTTISGAVGGLAAENLGGVITDTYATGVVTGGVGTSLGGLVALNGGTVVDGYWDTGTTGRPGSAAGIAISTEPLQSLYLPVAFANSGNWGIITGKSYPYLCFEFGNCGTTPQVVSGTVFTDQGVTHASPGPNVFGLVNGSSLVSAQTVGTVGLGANGYYYYLLAPNAIPSAGNVLTYEFGSGGPNGATLADRVSGSATGLNIFAGTLHEITAQTTYSTVKGDLATAEGGNGTAIGLVNGLVNLQVDASGAFGVDTAISFGSGSVTLNAQGPVTQTSIGLIAAHTLAGSSIGGTTLTAVNNFSNFGPWTDTGTNSPGINVASSVSLDVDGTVFSTGPVSLTSSNLGDPDLTLATNIGGTTVTLFANGAIDQTAGAITATTGLVATTQLAGGGAITLSSATNNIVGDVTLTTLNGTATLLDAGAISFTDTAGFTIQGLGGLQSGIATKSTVTLVSGGPIAETINNGSVTASTLSGSSAGAANFNNMNSVAGFGPFSTMTGGNNGALTLNDAGSALTVGGTLGTGSGTIFLNTQGPLLTVSAPLFTTGGITLSADTMSLGAQIGGSGAGAGQSSQVSLLTVGAGQPISLGAGAATGLALTDTALNRIRSTQVSIADAGAGPITFDGAFTAASSFGTNTGVGLDLSTASSAEFSGAIALQGGLLVTAATITQNAGTIAAGANSQIGLSAGGAITQTGGCCSLTASTFTGNSGGATTLNGANAIGTLTTFSAGGALSLDDTIALTTTGIIQAGTGGSGDLALTAPSMTLTGNGTSWAVQTPGNMTLTTTSGALALGALERATGILTLNSAGQITEDAGTGNIAAGTLTGSSAGGTNLASVSTPTLAAFSNATSGSLFIEDTLPTTITVTGALSTASGTTLRLLNFGPLALAAGSSLSAPGAGGIVAIGTTNGGTITQAAGSVITTGDLQGQSNGGVSLAGANQVAVLGPFSNLTSGDFSFNNAQSLATSGTVMTTGNMTLTTGAGDALTLAGAVIAGSSSTVTLNAGGTITEPSGSIAAANLVATTELDGGAAITLNRAANAIPGNVTLTALDTAGTALDAGAITFFDSTGFTIATSGGLQTGINTTGAATLQAAGSVSETGFGYIEATNLVVRALGGAISLVADTVPGNVTLTALNGTGTALASGNIIFDDQVGFTIAAQLGGGVGGLETGVGTTSTAALATNGLLTEAAGAVITSPSLTGTSGGGATLNGANLVGALGPFATLGDFSFTNAVALTANVTNLVGNVTLTTTGAGSTLTVAGISATGNAVSLVSAATIDETGGTIVAGAVTGSSVGGANLTGTNHVGTLGPFANSGNGLLAFTAAQALTTVGTVSSAGDLTLTTTSGNLTLGGNVIASAGTVTLSSAGTITAPGGVIDPGALLLSAVGSVSLPGANTVDTLAASITGAGASLTFNDTANNLTIGTVGAVSGVTTGSGAVTLTTTISGDITVSEPVNAGSAAATIAASGNLSIGGAGSVTAGAGATLATLGNFSNAAGTGAISVGAGNRWLVYSTDPALDTDGGLAPGFIQYAATYDVATLTGTTPAATGNGLLYSLAPQITLTGVSKIYDGTTAAPTSAAAYTSTGAVGGDTVVLDASGVAGSYAGADVTATPIDVTLTTGPTIAGATRGSIPVFGYTVATVTSDPIGAITPAALTASITGNPTKIYDGGTAATLTSADYSLSGFVAGQGAGVTQTAGTYASADAGTIAVTASLAASNFTPTGATLLSNYTLPTSATGPGTITPATLTYAANAATQTYGGTPALSGTVTGFVAGQTQATATTGTLNFTTPATAAANVGTYAIDGTGLTADNGDYLFVQAAANATALTIVPAALTVTPNAVATGFTGTPLNNTAYSDALANYTIAGLQNGQSLASAGIALTGALAFNGSTGTVVESPGTYTQGAGTLALGSTNNNYALSFTNPVPNNYVITTTPPPPAPTPTSEPVIRIVQPQPVAENDTTVRPAPFTFCIPIDNQNDPGSKYRCILPEFGAQGAAATR